MSVRFALFGVFPVLLVIRSSGLLFPFDLRVLDVERMCYVPGNGDESPASIVFRGDLYLLFERGDIVRCHHRAWKDRDSGELIRANGERWLAKTQRPKRIALHSDGSRRAVAIADSAAQGK